ncbi:MAG: tetratricopeptide repeat protein [Chloroflexota bacterium]
MPRVEKTVFISYRRTNVPWALAIYQDLTIHGYDVFFDYLSIDSGTFEKVILENIKTRAHFLIVLTPSALERCKEPNDWLRREIETAMDENRNIVPLMLESFDFGSPFVIQVLTGKLAKLNKFNGLRVYSEYFFEAMDKLRKRYLNVAVSDIALPTLNIETKEITENQKIAASEAMPVGTEQLTAQEWFERGFVFTENKNFSEAIRCYSESIIIKPDFAEAYNNRGNASFAIGNTNSAIADYTKAIRINPDFVEPYYNCAVVLEEKKDYAQAVAAYQKYLDLQGGIRYGNQKEVEKLIWDLETRK